MATNAGGNQANNLWDFIEDLPKIELHAHLNGCIREKTLFELAKERSVRLSPHHFPTNGGSATMYNKRPRSLMECFEMFNEIKACVNDLSALRRITKEALEDFAAHRVAYLELRSTPKYLLRLHSGKEKATKRDYLDVIVSEMRDFESKEWKRFEREATDTGRRRLPMVCRFLVSVDRSQSLEEAEENIDLAIKLSQEKGSLVVGVDLGGNPTVHDFQMFEGLFRKARSAGLKVTLHCAETVCGNDNSEACTEEERKAYVEAHAMLDFQPDRLGHALLLPPSLQEILLAKKIPVETCPTSNVMTLELAKKADGNLLHALKQHPSLLTWLDREHPLTVATDDPGVFDTTATQELMLLALAFGLKREKLTAIIEKAIEYCFCDADTKLRLQSLIRQPDRHFL